MKNANLSLSANVKTYGFIATVIAFMGLFIFKSNDTMEAVMTLKIHLAYTAYFGLGLFSLYALIKSKNPSWALWVIGLSATGYFLYPFATKYFPLSGLNDMPLLWVGWGVALFLWFGIHLASTKDYVRMFTTAVLSFGVVGLNFYILRWMFGSDYQMPDEGGVIALFWFCGVPAALGFGWLAIWRVAEGRKGVYAFAIFVCVLWLASFWLNLTALNNIWFGGCFPNTPIGQKCGLPTSRNMMPIAKVDTPSMPLVKEDTASNEPLVYAYTEVVMKKGGSLCGTLGMTPMEAKAFGKANNLRVSHKGHKLFVLVHPGQTFRKHENGTWELVK